ncbi:alpha/beta fold hydrolase [Marinomonas posidonica]|uniref:alpha/beta fold hydrolase n=1 Tax=Marinomonas posidonica TaxID=936476 RepID=UPI003735B187
MTEIHCLPGTMCDDRLWQQVSRYLDQSTVLNHQAIPFENSLDEMVACLLKRLPDSPVNLLGFSMGAYIAAALTVKHPHRIKRLMLVSNLATGLPEAERQQRLVALNWVAKQGYSGIPRKKAQSMLAASARDKEDLIALIQAMDGALGEASFVQQLTASLERPDLIALLKELTIPIHVLAGTEDGLLSVSDRQRFKDSQAAEWFDIHACGHMVPIEQPQLFAKYVRACFVE